MVSTDIKIIDTTEEVTVRGGKIYSFFKRAFDIVFSVLALIVFLIPLLICAILVKTTSRGPVIYTSKRIGKNGRVFNFYKFRSMCVGAEDQLEELLKDNEVEGGVTFKMKDDPRITKVGRILRKLSIDELPQLVNILKGDMTFVGPRPGTVREYELYSERDKKRLLVPQGLTGEWQVRGRSNTTFDEMIDMDIEYISKKRSAVYDLFLIVKTVTVIFTHHSGAE